MRTSEKAKCITYSLQKCNDTIWLFSAELFHDYDAWWLSQHPCQESSTETSNIDCCPYGLQYFRYSCWHSICGAACKHTLTSTSSSCNTRIHKGLPWWNCSYLSFIIQKWYQKTSMLPHSSPWLHYTNWHMSHLSITSYKHEQLLIVSPKSSNGRLK